MMNLSGSITSPGLKRDGRASADEGPDHVFTRFQAFPVYST